MNRRSLTDLAHEAVRESLFPGAKAIDATVGNGHDTLFLAKHVGAKGEVYGFDIQPAALSETRARLKQCTDCAPVALFLQGHEGIAGCLPGRLRGDAAVIMFNLGYLPGGDKRITTTAESTLRALNDAVAFLSEEGTLSVIAYPGHPEGEREAAEVMAWSRTLSADLFASRRVVSPSATGPILLIVRRRKKG